MIAPRVLAVHPSPLPASYLAARLGADLPAEVTVGRDGSIGEAAVRTSDLAILAPFAEVTLSRSLFSAGTLEGNPVAVRVPVQISVGVPNSTRKDLHPAQVWVFVPSGDSREARWQLRDSVSRVALVAHPGSAERQGAMIVGVAPSGAERTLLTLPPSASPQEVRQTVATGKFFASAGDYRLELRVRGNAIAFARFTIAADSEHAIVNACEQLPVSSSKTGPGN
jgi:hypothetical protein